MPPILNLRHLEAALEIHRLGSISRTTETVHLSQSAITQGLRKLERDLGFDVFERSHDGLTATEEGKIFLKRAQTALHCLQRVDSLLARTGRAKTRGPIHRSLTATQLRALMTVVEQGNYSVAARRLRLSQPTVHRAVKDAETICGYKFLTKSPSGVEAGWLAKQVARQVALFLSEISQGLEEVQEHLGQMTGQLRVGCLPLARTQIVPQAVTGLLKHFPEARVSIIDGPYDEQLHALLHGNLDVIVGALRFPQPSNEIVQTPLFRDFLSIVVRPGHPLASAPSMSAEELRRLDWIAPRQDTPARESFTQFFENNGVSPPEHVIECSSLAATRSMLIDSNRAALLSARQVEVDVRLGALKVSPLRLADASREIGFTLRKGWQPTLVQQHFLDRLRSQA